MNFKDYPLWFMFSTQRKILVISRVFIGGRQRIAGRIIMDVDSHGIAH